MLLRSSALLRSFHQFSLATVRLSTLAFPALYFWRMPVNSASLFSFTGNIIVSFMLYSFLIAFPLRGRCSSAHTGADEVSILPPHRSLRTGAHAGVTIRSRTLRPYFFSGSISTSASRFSARGLTGRDMQR